MNNSFKTLLLVLLLVCLSLAQEYISEFESYVNDDGDVVSSGIMEVEEGGEKYVYKFESGST
ncbi:hypothetical protein TcasGA2_TC006718 [Tribolium castaneum]|uniref:Uncharacterized protein n=1 Tax=Tribolium castaneum TaxID=7070 RepID=D6WYV6_TRICA|nr:hypothetical protein TcasGA2_TC006718 [Tribolium castaneum]